MSIIIKGMEMPHDCPNCEFAVIGYVSPMSTDCTLYCRATDCVTDVIKEKSYEDLQKYHSRPDWCPLLPLPEGHGRLGDLDKLDYAFTALRFNEDGSLKHWDDRKNWCLHGSEIETLLANAPTIVPAEGGGEDGV